MTRDDMIDILHRYRRGEIKSADAAADEILRAKIPHGAAGGPTVDDPNRPYCKPDQSCCDFCCGN